MKKLFPSIPEVPWLPDARLQDHTQEERQAYRHARMDDRDMMIDRLGSSKAEVVQ